MTVRKAFRVSFAYLQMVVWGLDRRRMGYGGGELLASTNLGRSQ